MVTSPSAFAQRQLELGMTGLVLAFLQLKAPLNLVTTAYGVVLLIKSCVLLIALLLVTLTLHTHDERKTRWWRVEGVLLAAIIALAGVLVSLPLPIV